jgi:hypothetical protein
LITQDREKRSKKRGYRSKRAVYGTEQVADAGSDADEKALKKLKIYLRTAQPPARAKKKPCHSSR